MSPRALHHIRSKTAALALLALLAACAKHFVSTVPGPMRPINVHSAGPFMTNSIPPGTIRGVVIDDSTGRGLSGVIVSIAQKQRDGRRIGAVTDSLGRFLLSFAPFDTLTFATRAMGYAAHALPARLDPSHGYILVLTLSRLPPRAACAWPPGPEPAVIVLVRDALSGRAPAAGATVKITAPGYRDSVTTVPAPGDSALVFRLGTYGYFHTYSLEVQSPGRRTWRAGDVTEVKAPCGAPMFPVQQIWLVPQ